MRLGLPNIRIMQPITACNALTLAQRQTKAPECEADGLTRRVHRPHPCRQRPAGVPVHLAVKDVVGYESSIRARRPACKELNKKKCKAKEYVRPLDRKLPRPIADSVALGLPAIRLAMDARLSPLHKSHFVLVSTSRRRGLQLIWCLVTVSHSPLTTFQTGRATPPFRNLDNT